MHKAANIQYIFLFHLKILLPSKFPNGIKLNKASQTFILNPYNKTMLLPNIKVKKRKIKAKAILIEGPAIEIFPFLSLLTYPWIITAPGAANTNPKKLIAIASSNMESKLLNSAKQR